MFIPMAMAVDEIGNEIGEFEIADLRNVGSAVKAAAARQSKCMVQISDDLFLIELEGPTGMEVMAFTWDETAQTINLRYTCISIAAKNCDHYFVNGLLNAFKKR